MCINMFILLGNVYETNRTVAPVTKFEHLFKPKKNIQEPENFSNESCF